MSSGTSWIQGKSHAPAVAYPLVLNPLGANVGVNKTNPSYAFDVTGDMNCTGTFRVNGTPISGGTGITAQNVVTGSRALGTSYQNTTGKPMFVSISLNVNNGYVVVSSDSNPSPVAAVAQAGNPGATPTGVLVAFWVLPGNYYKAAMGAGSGGLNQWTEWN